MKTTKTLEGLIQIQNDFNDYYNILVSKDFSTTQGYVDPTRDNFVVDSLGTFTDDVIIESNIVVKDSANIHNNLTVDGTTTSGSFSGDGAQITNIDACNITHGNLDLVNLMHLNERVGGCLTYDGNSKWSVASNITITNDLITQSIFDVNSYTSASTRITMDANILLKGSVTRRKFEQMFADELSAGTFSVGNSSNTWFFVHSDGSVGIRTDNAQMYDLYINGKAFAQEYYGDGYNITGINASNIDSGILSIAYGGTGTSRSTGTGDVVLNQNPNLQGNVLMNGKLTIRGSNGLIADGGSNTGYTGTGLIVLNNNPTIDGILTSQYFVGDGYGITNLNASNIDINTFNLNNLLHVNGYGFLEFANNTWKVSSNLVAQDVKRYVSLSCNSYVLSGLTDSAVTLDVSPFFNSPYNYSISYRTFIPYVPRGHYNGALDAVGFNGTIVNVNPEYRNVSYQVWIEGYVADFDWFSERFVVSISEASIPSMASIGGLPTTFSATSGQSVAVTLSDYFEYVYKNHVTYSLYSIVNSARQPYDAYLFKLTGDALTFTGNGVAATYNMLAVIQDTNFKQQVELPFVFQVVQ